MNRPRGWGRSWWKRRILEIPGTPSQPGRAHGHRASLRIRAPGNAPLIWPKFFSPTTARPRWKSRSSWPTNSPAGRGETRQPKFLSLDGAYHGDTVGAVCLGHIDLFHKAYARTAVQIRQGHVAVLLSLPVQPRQARARRRPRISQVQLGMCRPGGAEIRERRRNAATRTPHSSSSRSCKARRE